MYPIGPVGRDRSVCSLYLSNALRSDFALHVRRLVVFLPTRETYDTYNGIDVGNWCAQLPQVFGRL